MSKSGPTTRAVRRLPHNSEGAQQKLLDRFMPQLRRIAHQQLQSVPRNMGDSEQAALEVLNKLFMSARAGRLPNVRNSKSATGFLISALYDRVRDIRRDANTLKSGGGLVIGEGPQLSEPEDLAMPDAEVNLQIREFISKLMQCLTPIEAKILDMEIDGYHQWEIAETVGRSLRTVNASIASIRVKTSELIGR